ncbi:hypothetical protein ACFW04_002306 [Cataglyphis niger]
MCFARMTQIIKQILHLSFLYIFIFVFILCTSTYILIPTSDKHTPINVNNDEDNNNWIYNLSLNKKKETVLSIKSIKDFNTNDVYNNYGTKIAIIIMLIIAVLLMCCCCRKISSGSSYQVELVNDRRNVEGEYRNNFEMITFFSQTAKFNSKN